MRLTISVVLILYVCSVSAGLPQLLTEQGATFVAQLGTGRAGRFGATVDTFYTGCISPKAQVTVVVPSTCNPLIPSEPYLVIGKPTGPLLRQTVTVTCEGLKPVSSVAPSELHFLAASVDRCKKGKRMQIKCADGAKKKKCKSKLVCNKKKWCPGAKSCKVNPCDCTPEYYNEDKQRVCTSLDTNPAGAPFCPNSAAPVTCKRDACDLWGPQLLEAQGCEEWSAATQCVSSSCGGCHATPTDDRGQPVCEAHSTSHMCQDLKLVGFGRCKKVLGFGMRNGQCVPIKGCSTDGQHLHKTKKACLHQCKCMPLDNVDLGACKASLGFAVVGDKCTQVFGCRPKVRGVIHALYPSMKACAANCADAPPLPQLPTGPSVECPSAPDGSGRLEVELPAGVVAGPVTYPLPVAAGEGVRMALVRGVLSGGVVRLGETEVAYAVVDAQNRTATCAFTIVATAPASLLAQEDTEPPALVCPGEEDEEGTRVFEVNLAPERKEARVSYPFPSSADNRPGATLELVSGPNTGEMFERGDTRVTYRATDAVGLSTTCTFLVRLLEPEPNDPPTSSSIPAQQAVQGAGLELDLSSYFSDPDGDALVYFVAGLPVGSGLTIQFDTGLLVGVPTFADATAPSPLEVRIMASDGRAGRTIQEMQLTVLPDPTNSAPVAVALADMTVTEGQEARLRLAPGFTDPDGDQLDYFVADLPFGSGLELYENGELLGTPTFADATAPQPLVIRIMASDGKASVVTEARITVLPNPDNTVPVSATVESQEGQEGSSFLLDLSKYFVDDDRTDILDYFVAGLPFGSGLTLYSSGVLSGVMTAADALAQQPLQIKVLASDGKASTQENFELSVAEDLGAREAAAAAAAAKAEAAETAEADDVGTNEKGAETITVVMGRQVDEPMASHFTGRLTGKLTFTAQGLPVGSGLAVDGNGGVLYGVPNPLDLAATPLRVSITATGQNGAAEQVVTINVTPR